MSVKTLHCGKQAELTMPYHAYLYWFAIFFHNTAKAKPFLFLLSTYLNRTKRVNNEICSTLQETKGEKYKGRGKRKIKFKNIV